jgi:hypothetical protein
MQFPPDYDDARVDQTAALPDDLASGDHPPMPFLGGAQMVRTALALVQEFGSDARAAAQLRCAQSKMRENVRHYCLWREADRLLAMMDHNSESAETRH